MTTSASASSSELTKESSRPPEPECPTRASHHGVERAIATVGLLVVTLVAYERFLGIGFAGSDSLLLIETSRVSSLNDLVLQFTRPVMADTRRR
jgi:hypothetical protein